jgi:enterochelin esterase-like enzyme
VIYLLHGLGDTDELWTRNKQPWMSILELMNRGVGEGRFGEMIIVMPDERTKWFGSFYTNSSVTGNWEEFTTKELISYIDNKYRTLAQPGSRGIAGHSMGGYGAITLAMKYPEFYSVVYGLNPALIAWARDLSIDHPGFKQVLTAKTLEELLKGGVKSVGLVTIAQAFSPNPQRPPFFADFPFELVEGKLKPATVTFQRWQEHFPLNMIERYQANLAKLRGIRFDSGHEDEFLFIPVNCRNFSAALTSSGIEHVFEEYNGDHRNRLWGRNGRLYTEVLPYFWFLLDSQKQ